MSAVQAVQAALFSGAVLVVDDDRDVRRVLARKIGVWGLDVLQAENLAQAKAYVAQGGIACVICDKHLPDGDGFRWVCELNEDSDAEFDLVVITGDPEAEQALEVGGRFKGYLPKPFLMEDIRKFLLPLISSADEIEPNTRFAPHEGVNGEGDSGFRFLAESNEMIQIANAIGKLSKMETTCILTGESGTGKEVVARAIHDRSRRKDKKFIAVNCSAIPEALLESELFGYEKGAFTDAKERKLGLFEEAKGGTIFLDEVTEMSLAAQPKLLRVLQRRVVTRVGSSDEIPVDVRVIAATNRDFVTEIRERRFREDLYFRLKGSEISLPPLRDRGEKDIVKLIRHYAQKAVDEVERGCMFTKVAWSALLKYKWPGNVRELENAVRHAVQSCSYVVFVSDLPKEVQASLLPESVVNLASKNDTGSAGMGAESIVEMLRQQCAEGTIKDGALPPMSEIEKKYLEFCLSLHGGNRARVCKLIKVDRKYLVRRLGLVKSGERVA